MATHATSTPPALAEWARCLSHAACPMSALAAGLTHLPLLHLYSPSACPSLSCDPDASGPRVTRRAVRSAARALVAGPDRGIPTSVLDRHTATVELFLEDARARGAYVDVSLDDAVAGLAQGIFDDNPPEPLLEDAVADASRRVFRDVLGLDGPPVPADPAVLVDGNVLDDVDPQIPPWVYPDGDSWAQAAAERIADAASVDELITAVWTPHALFRVRDVGGPAASELERHLACLVGGGVRVEQWGDGALAEAIVGAVSVLSEQPALLWRVMGFGLTSGSVAMPLPSRAVLRGSFDAPATGQRDLEQHALSAGARAWAKHVNRTQDGRWPEVAGSVVERNAVASALCDEVLDRVLWLNIHVIRGSVLVLEVRSVCGRGLRWSGDGSVFIGFLEPHVETT